MAKLGSIAADDLKPRTWVMVTGLKPRNDFVGDYCGSNSLADQIAAMNGLRDAKEFVRIQGAPLYIEAVSLPFLVVSFPTGQREPIDTRSYRFQKVGKRYVEAALTMSVDTCREHLLADDGQLVGSGAGSGDGECVGSLD